MVPAGSPSRGGDVTVYVPAINQPSLPTPFYSVLVSVSDLMALSTVFHSINFPRQLSAFSLCSSGLISAILVLSTIYLFVKVSLSPAIILCSWLGLRHLLTKLFQYSVRNGYDSKHLKTQKVTWSSFYLAYVIRGWLVQIELSHQVNKPSVLQSIINRNERDPTHLFIVST